jgi:hypothetical protein
MKGQSDWQRHLPVWEGGRPDMEEAQQAIDILNKEIVIFENSEHSEVGCKAHDEEEPSSFSGRGFYQPAGDVIDCDDSKKNQEISRYEGCVEVTAGC